MIKITVIMARPISLFFMAQLYCRFMWAKMFDRSDGNDNTGHG